MVSPPRPRRLEELPPLSPDTIARVQRSIAQVQGDQITLAEAFYDILFRIAPASRALFPPDMTMQTERLAKALLAAVKAAADGTPETVVPALQHWGVRHRLKYNVTDEMYVYVCHALVQAVRQLTDPTDTRAASAWTEVYEWLAAVMIAGADEAERADYFPEAELTGRDRHQKINGTTGSTKGVNVIVNGFYAGTLPTEARRRGAHARQDEPDVDGADAGHEETFPGRRRLPEAEAAHRRRGSFLRRLGGG